MSIVNRWWWFKFLSKLMAFSFLPHCIGYVSKLWENWTPTLSTHLSHRGICGVKIKWFDSSDWTRINVSNLIYININPAFDPSVYVGIYSYTCMDVNPPYFIVFTSSMCILNCILSLTIIHSRYDSCNLAPTRSLFVSC